MISYIREQWSALIIVAGALYALFAFVVDPALVRRAELSGDVARAASELDGLSDPSQVTDHTDVTRRVARLLSHRFGADTLLGEQDRINALALEAGLRIENVEPDSGIAEDAYGPLSLRATQVRVSAVGTYDEIAVFLSALDHAPMAVLEEFSVREAEEREAALSLTLRTASVRDGGSVLASGDVE